MIILLIIMHAALATIFPIGRIVTQICAPVFFTGARMALSGCIFLGYYLVRNKRFSPGILGAVGAIITFTIAGIYLTTVPELWALQYIPSAKASFIFSLSPFAAAILSYFFFNEKMTLKKLLGLIIGLVGFMIMIIHHAPGEVIDDAIGVFSMAEIAMIIAAISTAVGWITMRRHLRTKACSAIEALGISMILGSGLAFITSAFMDSWNPVPIVDYANNVSTVVLLLGLSVITSNLIGYTLYTLLLKTYTATFISFSGFIQPLFAAFYGWIFLGEFVTWYFFGAALLVFIGLYIFYIEELRQGYISNQT